MLKVLERVPAHPLLFAAAVPLSILASNIYQVRPSIAGRAIVAAVVLSLMLWVLIRFFSGDWRRAAVFASILIVLFSTYGFAYSLFREAGELGWELARHRYMLPVWLALAVVSILAIKRRSGELLALTSVFNFAAAVLVILPLTRIIQAELGSGVVDFELPDPAGASSSLAFTADGSPPDIYYIITDAYSRDDYLLSNYGHDNSAFLKALEELGFYIARCSQSNYSQTGLSLTSSMNLNYLEDLSDEFRPGNGFTHGRDEFIRDNLVQQELRALGYSVVAFETGFFWTELDDAEHYYEVPARGTLASTLSFSDINEFEVMLLQNTGFRLLTDAASATGVLSQVLPSFGSIYRERTLYVLGQLDPERVPALRGPKFVFVHLIAPHWPFVFDREGEFFNVETDRSDKEAYINQLIYLNGRLEQIIQGIIETSSTPPIIILQADHGNLFGGGEQNAILNAYLLPETDGNDAYPQISPVNSFRLIFDEHFNGDYGLLPDKSYFSTYKDPFVFENVPNTREGCGGM